MSWESALVVYTLILGFALLAGISASTAMGLVGIVGITIASRTDLWRSLGDIVWNTTNSFTFVAVPLFVLMGEIILRSGISTRLYTGLSVLLKRVPGRLAQSNILACAMFSAVSGSSTATALTIGTVALPEMRARGYKDEITIGTLTGGGALGNLIPPSIFLIIYGAVVQESVIDLYIASVVPGLIATVMFMAYVAIRCAITPALVPPKTPRHSRQQILGALWNCLPITVLIIAVIGAMYLGIVTPTEAAAFGCALSLVLSLLYRGLTWRGLRDSLRSTIAVSCVIMFIVINGQFLGFAVVHAGIGRGVARALLESGFGPLPFFTALFVLYLVLGGPLDGVTMMLITVPVIYPTLRAMGFDGVWFGVILVIQTELAQLTPPIALNLFAIQSVGKDITLGQATRASLPFILMLSLLSFLLYLFPQLALWLPATMKT